MTSIPIERLTTGTTIYAVGGDFGPFGGFATVTAIEDQGEGEAFLLTLDHGGWIGEQTMAVDKGGRVTFGGVGEPKLLPFDDASEEALLARIAADDADSWAMIDKLDAARGCVSQNVDAPLTKAVADALGVPALLAAE
jgi:hypothetical protein